MLPPCEGEASSSRSKVDVDAETRWWLQVGINGFRIRALYDPGASRTVMGNIGLQLASACGRQLVPATGRGARVANGAYTPLVGHVTLPFEVAGIKKDLRVAIMPELDTDCYLGANFMRTFETVHDACENQLYVKTAGRKVDLEVASISETLVTTLASIGLADVQPQEKERLNELISKHRANEVGPLGCTTWIDHSINTGTTRPIKQRYYPVSKKMEEEMHSQVDEMLSNGVIEPSNSGWSSPVVMVKKANGKYRFCVDFRKVNAVSQPDAYPLPYMDAILRKLQKAKYISTIDLSSAYHQIPLEEGSRPTTAFTVPGKGLFQFKRMPYGLSYAGATFQRLIDKVIGPELEPYAYSYLDDIIIVSEDFETHMKILDKVLTRIQSAGLTINWEKSEFCRNEVKYLGVIVNRDGFRPDPAKVEPILNYPAPKNIKQLRRFLGMASWYRKFLDNFATIAEPLTRLTSVKRAYVWTDVQQDAFEKVKALVASAPLLQRPDFEQTFVVQTDASDTGLGVCLIQMINGEERVLEFASCVMNAAQRNYSVTERECLAVVWAIQKFRPYIEGYHFKVITDHSSLRWLCNLANPTGRLARWALELQGYSFEVEHRRGALNHVPDALSRMFEEEEPSVSSMAYDIDNIDEWYETMHHRVENNPRKCPRWKLVDGKLYTYRPNKLLSNSVGDEDAWKLAVPEYLRKNIIRQCHDEPTAGHLGREKTIRRVTEQYYWPRMYLDVEAYVRSCLVCQQCKAEQKLPGGLMGKRVVSRPWQVVAADIMELPRSKNKKKYLLVFEDLFTRWIEVIPVAKADGPTIWKYLWENIILRWGLPETFLSDNGTEFKNQLVDDNLQKYGVNHEFTPKYHPQANPVERVNRTLKQMIRSYADKDHVSWDENICELVCAYNRAAHASTGLSPAVLNTLRQPETPSEMRKVLQDSAIINAESEALEQWKSKLQGVDRLYEQAAERMNNQQDRQEIHYNKRHRDLQFQVGDWVWKKNVVLSNKAAKISGKLVPLRGGPYMIAQKLGSNTYAIIDKDGVEDAPVSVEKLTAYVEDEEENEDNHRSSDSDSEEAAASEPSSESESEAEDSGPRPRQPSCEPLAPKKRGRPRLNTYLVQKTIVKPKDDPPRITNSQPVVKRKRGRPKGSNKLTTASDIANPSPRRTRAQRHLANQP